MASLASMQSYLGECSPYFTAFGVIAAAYVTLRTLCGYLRFTRDFFWGPMLGLSANVKKAGAWAVVTGCTDGIGKAYAEQLAKKGLNIVLMSRTQSKLDDLAKQIESEYKVQTRVIAVDFTRTDIYEKIKTGLQGLEIGTLVNNVGMAYTYPEFFVSCEDREKMIPDMINCNNLSAFMMISIVLPGMLERRRGYIINNSSQSAERPIALLSLYGATKASLDYFTKALQIEYGSKGITFQSVRPGFVATKLSGIRRSNAFAPYPDGYVKSALNTLGITNSTNGFWIHDVQSMLSGLFPDWMILSVMSKARKAALKKIERKKAQQ